MNLKFYQQCSIGQQPLYDYEENYWFCKNIVENNIGFNTQYMYITELFIFLLVMYFILKFLIK
jgi:hypothetical protein